MRIKKAEVSKRQYSSKAKNSNVRDFATAKNTVSNRVYGFCIPPLLHSCLALYPGTVPMAGTK